MKNIYLSIKIAGIFTVIALLLLSNGIMNVNADANGSFAFRFSEQSYSEDAVITKDDLPGFHEASKSEVVGDLALAKRITSTLLNPSIEIKNISYFRSDNVFQSEYVINFLAYPISENEISTFNLVANDPQSFLEELFKTTQASGAVEEPRQLSELGGIGEKSVGFSMLLGQEPFGNNIDVLWVRRGEYIESTWVFYPIGQEPSIDLYQLGSLIDRRVAERFIGTSFRSSGLMVPEITTHIPTPLDISTNPSVISTNLLLAALMLLPFAVAAELFTRFLAEREESLLHKFQLKRWLKNFQQRSASSLGVRLKQHEVVSNTLRLSVILIFFGLIFSLLEPTWNPFSVTGLVLFISMTVAYGLVGLIDDIVQWRVVRKWGNQAELTLRPINLLIAAVSTITSRLLRLVPGLMFGTPEVLNLDETQLDIKKRNRLLKISISTILTIGLSFWALTTITTFVQQQVISDSFRNIMGGLEGFFLLVFAVTLENTFIKMLGLPGSFGEALRKRNRWLWLLGLVFVTFAFYHTLINPRGELAEALQNSNVLIFVLASGSFVVLTFGLWIYTRIKTRKVVVSHQTNIKKLAFVLTSVFLLIGSSILGIFLFIQQKQLLLTKDEIPLLSENKTLVTITQTANTDDHNEIMMDFKQPALVGKLCFLPQKDVSESLYDAYIWRSVQEIAAQYGAQANYIAPETSDDSGYTKAIDQFIQDDCDLIIGEWFSEGRVFLTAASSYPDQKFFVFHGNSDLSNLWAVQYSTYEGAYLAGYTAAATSKSGKVGTFTGFQNPAVDSIMNCFAQGVNSYNQVHQMDVAVYGWDIETQQGIYATSYTSPEEGSAFTEYLLTQGVDIIFPVAGADYDTTGYSAATIAQQEEGLHVIGMDIDWAISSPGFSDVVITSVEQRYDQSLAIAVDALANGEFLGGEHLGSLGSGEIRLSPLRNFSSLLLPGISDELSQLAYSSNAKVCQPLQSIESNAVQPILTLTPQNTSTPTQIPMPTATPDMRIYNPENGHYYLVTRELMWYAAIDYCSSLGGHLLIINDASENVFVFNLNPYALLGATDKENEGNWVWGATGESFSYSNWDNGEPSNCAPSDNGCIPEHYLAFWGSDRLGWNDIPDSRGSYICEWEE